MTPGSTLKFKIIGQRSRSQDHKTSFQVSLYSHTDTLLIFKVFGSRSLGSRSKVSWIEVKGPFLGQGQRSVGSRSKVRSSALNPA